MTTRRDSTVWDKDVIRCGALLTSVAMLTLVLVGCSSMRDHGDDYFITDEEFQTAPPAPPEETERQVVFGAPQIVPEDPKPGATVSIPLRLRVHFEPGEGARIDPQTLRVTATKEKKMMFGKVVLLGPLDITDEVRECCKVSEQGVEGEIRKFADGKYEFTLRVSDTQGRMGQAVLSYTVTNSR